MIVVQHEGQILPFRSEILDKEMQFLVVGFQHICELENVEGHFGEIFVN